MLHVFGTPWQRKISMVFLHMAVKYIFFGLWLMKIISDTNPIIHELSKYVSSCTSSFFMPIRHFPPQMLYYTRRPRDLAFGLLNFRKGFFLWRELLPIRSQPGSPGKIFLDFFGRRVFPNIYWLLWSGRSRRSCWTGSRLLAERSWGRGMFFGALFRRRPGRIGVFHYSGAAVSGYPAWGWGYPCAEQACWYACASFCRELREYSCQRSGLVL